LVCGSQSELGGLLDNVAGSAAVGDEEVAILIGGLELEAGVAFVDGFKVLQEPLELFEVSIAELLVGLVSGLTETRLSLTAAGLAAELPVPVAWPSWSGESWLLGVGIAWVGRDRSRLLVHLLSRF